MSIIDDSYSFCVGVQVSEEDGVHIVLKDRNGSKPERSCNKYIYLLI